MKKRCWFCFAWFLAADLVDYTLVGDEDTTVKVCERCKGRRTRRVPDVRNYREDAR